MPVSATPRRVTIVCPNTRIDVALPLESTLAELVPQLVAMAGAESLAPPGPPGSVTGWALSRLGSPALGAGLTVAAAGIRDGDVLHLEPRSAKAAPLLFDDVVDAIASAADTRPGGWRPSTARRVALVGTVVGFSCCVALLAVAGPRWPWPPLVTGTLAVLLAIAGGALSRAYADSAAGAVLAGAGIPAALLAGAEVLPGDVFDIGPGRLGLALAAVTGYAVLAAVAVADRLPVFVGVAVAGAVGCLAATGSVLLGAPPAHGAAVTVALVTAFSPALPMLSLRMGRLPLPRVPSDVDAFRAEERPTLGPDVIDETGTAEDALTGLLAAVAVVVAGCTVVLLAGTSRWAWSVAGVAGVVLLLRSRAFSGAAQRVVLLAAGAAVLIGTAGRLAAVGSPALRVVLLVVFAAAGTISIVYAARATGRDAAPYLNRLLDVAEFVALVSLVPLAAAVLDVYTRIRALAG